MASVDWLWNNPSAYNFASSEWGGLVFKGFYALVIFGLYHAFIRPWLQRIHEHMRCHVEGCTRWGHVVQGTSFRACKPHCPHHRHPITPEHIRKAVARLD